MSDYYSVEDYDELPLFSKVNALKPHERAVVMDWLKEPTDGR